VALAGEKPYQFLLATIVPPGIIELPALLMIEAAALRCNTVIIHPSPDRSVSESFLMRMSDFTRVFLGVGLPLLIVAAFVEAHVTTQVLFWVYG